MRIRVASTAGVFRSDNPYLRLLYGVSPEGKALSGFQSDVLLDVVESPGVSISWIWSHRHDLDVLHLHWPSFLYAHPQLAARWLRFLRMTVGLLLTRLVGIKIVWTAHNVMPHKSSGWFIDWLGRRVVMAVSDLVIVHQKWCMTELKKRFGGRCRQTVIPHMTYEGVYPDPIPQSEARSRLRVEPDALVVVHFGLIRRNKHVPLILQEFSLANAAKQRMLIAGSCMDDDVAAEISDYCRADSRILASLDRVQPEDVALWLSAADVAVIGGNITTSGSLFLYLTYGLPVILPKTLSREFSKNTDWLITCNMSARGELANLLNQLSREELATTSQSADTERLSRTPVRIHQMLCSELATIVGDNR
ncbi:MAG: hypothetical protein MK110_17780 [Fuerstiella sp.]|nr:hypothetical protein [Fuerstiella sp.]